MSEHDKRLVIAAAEILHGTEEQGIQLSQARLARQMRARGLTIPNQRLRWLAVAARARLAEIQAEFLPGEPWTGR